MRTSAAARPIEKVDFELVFNKMPGLCLVLDASFTIVARNEEHARQTFTQDKPVVGQSVFAAFPDNPDHSGAMGVAQARQSLLKVMKTRQPDVIALIRYDIKAPGGPFQPRYWSVTNTPILGQDGYVRWILVRAEEVDPDQGQWAVSDMAVGQF